MDRKEISVIQAGYTPPPELTRARNGALLVGLLVSALFVSGLFIDRAQFFHAYLVGFIFWAGITLGSLALLMLQHLTGGAWGVVIRRVLEASTRTLPLILLLFIPVVVGLKQIYPWMNAAEMSSPALRLKAAKYLNPSFFVTRAAIYFALWSVLALLLNWLSLKQDRTADLKCGKQMRLLSGPGLGIFVITVTFAAIDWVMSLDPSWSSTIFGLIFVASWTMSALAFTVLASAWLSQREPMNAVLRPSHFQDLGNLTLTLVLAIPDYLVGQSAGRDDLVRGAQARRLGRDCAGDRDPAICVSVLDSAVAGGQEQRAQTGAAGAFDSVDARAGCDLADRADLQSRALPPELDGCGCAHRHRRIVARSFFVAVAAKTFDADKRSAD